MEISWKLHYHNSTQLCYVMLYYVMLYYCVACVVYAGKSLVTSKDGKWHSNTKHTKFIRHGMKAFCFNWKSMSFLSKSSCSIQSYDVYLRWCACMFDAFKPLHGMYCNYWNFVACMCWWMIFEFCVQFKIESNAHTYRERER